LLLAMILKKPDMLEYSLNHIQIDHMAGDLNRALYRNLVFYYNNIVKELIGPEDESGANVIDFFAFKDWLKSEIASLPAPEADFHTRHLDRLAIIGDREFYDLEFEAAKAEAIKIILYLKKNYFLERMREIERLVCQAEKSQEPSRANELMEELKILTDEYRNMTAV